MKIKIFINWSCILFITFIMTSCAIKGENMYKKGNEMVDSQIEYFLSAVENHDTQKLKNLFAQNAIQMQSDFEGNINRLFEYYKGKHIKSELVSGGISTSKKEDKGKSALCRAGTYSVITDISEYFIYIKYINPDDFDKNNKGIFSIYIIDKNDYNYSDELYTGEIWCAPGLNINKSSSIDSKVDEIANSIVSSLAEKNSQEFLSLFSSSAVNTSDFNKNFDSLFSTFQTEYFKPCIEISGSIVEAEYIQNGYDKLDLCCVFSIGNGANKYWFSFVSRIADTLDSDNIGINSLYVLSADGIDDMQIISRLENFDNMDKGIYVIAQ